MADRRRRTPWFPRSMPPVHHGVYECAVMITSRAPLFKWELEWDGKGFLTPCPMVVRKWRGLVKRPAGVAIPQGVQCEAGHAPRGLCEFGPYGWRGVVVCKHCKQAPPDGVAVMHGQTKPPADADGAG